MLERIKHFWSVCKVSFKKYQQITKHTCRVLSIEKDNQDNFIATVQLVNRSQVLKMKPEEILANDKLTDCFSQRDIRTLTYLGYLELNSPKYKILAKHLSETDNRLIFALQEKGKKKPIIKTADEISSDKDLLSALDQRDAHTVGYTSATEQSSLETEQMKKLLQSEKTGKK